MDEESLHTRQLTVLQRLRHWTCWQVSWPRRAEAVFLWGVSFFMGRGSFHCFDVIIHVEVETRPAGAISIFDQSWSWHSERLCNLAHVKADDSRPDKSSFSAFHSHLLYCVAKVANFGYWFEQKGFHWSFELAVIPTPEKSKQEGHVFRVIFLSYIRNSRPAWVTKGTVSKETKMGWGCNSANGVLA